MDRQYKNLNKQKSSFTPQAKGKLLWKTKSLRNTTTGCELNCQAWEPYLNFSRSKCSLWERHNNGCSNMQNQNRSYLKLPRPNQIYRELVFLLVRLPRRKIQYCQCSTTSNNNNSSRCFSNITTFNRTCLLTPIQTTIINTTASKVRWCCTRNKINNSVFRHNHSSYWTT